MKKSISKLIALMLCVVMCVLLTACGSSKKDDAPSSQAVSEKSAEAPASTAPAETTSKEHAPAEVEKPADSDEEYIEYDIDIIRSNITEAYGGAMENGEYVGFGINDDGSFALMLFFDADQHITFVGEAEIQDTFVTIYDDVNELEITFEVTYGDDDGIIIDIGEYGAGALAAITVDDLVETLVEVVENTADNG